MFRRALLLSFIACVVASHSAYCMKKTKGPIIDEMGESEQHHTVHSSENVGETESENSPSQSSRMKFKLGFEF